MHIPCLLVVVLVPPTFTAYVLVVRKYTKGRKRLRTKERERERVDNEARALFVCSLVLFAASDVEFI